MVQKHVWIFVYGHYLFREANSSPRVKLEENCEVQGTANVQGQYPSIFWSQMYYTYITSWITSQNYIWYVPLFSCYRSGTILLTTKEICLKRMSRLISIIVDYMLGKRYTWHNYTQMLSAFPRGTCRTQHVRRMHSSIVSMIQSVLEFRFTHVLPQQNL